MITPARPTQRCLGEDLSSDWDKASHHALAGQTDPEIELHKLGHPIIRKAAADFPGSEDQDSDVARESISGLSDPVWWKVKTGSRWRGAVYEDPETGQAWLCAAGYRREREASDFYREFMRVVGARGPSAFLPTEDDRARFSSELREVTLHRWELDLQEFVRQGVEGLLDAGGSATTTVVTPGGDGAEVARVSIEVAAEQIDGERLIDLVVSIECLDYAYLELVHWVEMVVLSAADCREQRWAALPVGGVLTSSQMIEAEELDAFVGQLREPRAPGYVEAGSVAHYAHERRLTQSYVDGDGVKSLCGSFFVPRQDYESLPTCRRCADILRALPE